MSQEGTTVDRERFDLLTRLFANRSSRRAMIGALVGMILVDKSSDALAEPGKAKTKGRGQGRGHGPNGAPGRLPDGDWDPGDGSTCVPGQCPPDPKTGKRGRCCPGGWCSCGDKCCTEPVCWIVSTQSTTGDSPQVV